MMTIFDQLANIERLANSGPQMSKTELQEYERICARIQRSTGDLRRATTRGDTKLVTAAERSLNRAKALRAAFLGPKVDHRWAPERIIHKTDAPWYGKARRGVHRHECEMILDHKDLAGPQYHTVRVLVDDGGPPTDARHAPSSMGVAWYAIDSRIKSGTIVILDDEYVS